MHKLVQLLRPEGDDTRLSEASHQQNGAQKARQNEAECEIKLQEVSEAQRRLEKQVHHMVHYMVHYMVHCWSSSALYCASHGVLQRRFEQVLRLEEAEARRESEEGGSEKLRDECARQQVPSLPSPPHIFTLALILTLSPTPAPSTLPSPQPAISCSRARRASPQQPAAISRPNRHRHLPSGAYPSRRTLLHVAPRRAARFVAARPFSRRWRATRLCPVARRAAAAAPALSKTLLLAAPAAASEVPSPAPATPTRDRSARPRACAANPIGARPILFPRPRSALQSTRRSHHLVAVRLRAALNGPTLTLTLMPLSPVCPAGSEVVGTSIDCAGAPPCPHPCLKQCHRLGLPLHIWPNIPERSLSKREAAPPSLVRRCSHRPCPSRRLFKRFPTNRRAAISARRGARLLQPVPQGQPTR